MKLTKDRECGQRVPCRMLSLVVGRWASSWLSVQNERKLSIEKLGDPVHVTNTVAAESYLVGLNRAT